MASPTGNTNVISPKPLCKYGSKCYRKNSEHLNQYQHPLSERKILSKARDDTPPLKATDDVPPLKRSKTDPDGKVSVKIDKFFKPLNRNHTIPPTISTHPGDGKETDKNNLIESPADGITVVVGDNNENSKDDNASTESSLKILNPTELPSANDIHDTIKQNYRMEMPEDFYKLWELCVKLKPDSPKEAFRSTLDLTLSGPYDLLSDDAPPPCNYLTHCRYYYDPPEFMTVINGNDRNQFHLGYYRDDPAELPSFVAANTVKEGCLFKQYGDNIFCTLKHIIEEKLKCAEFPSEKKTSLSAIQNEICAMATKHGFCTELKCKHIKIREKKVVCKTMNTLGLVVPVDKDDVGYRPVPVTLRELKIMLKNIAESKTEDERNRNFEPLQELITLVQFANDEGDPGEGLELGLQLFCFGAPTFHRVIKHLLTMAYDLLNRNLYSEIINAHLAHRESNPLT